MEQKLLEKISELYREMLTQPGLTDIEEDVLEKLGECLDILNAQVKKGGPSMKQKKQLSYDDAVVMLKEKVSGLSFGDILYEAAHEAFMRVVEEIEKKHDIVGYGGAKYDSDTDDECWFDEDRDEGVEYIMQQIQDYGKED